MASKKYNIVHERIEIYKDFALNLLYYIYNYYLDSETLSEDQDIYNHYSWCFNKVCDEFLMEGLNFTENQELKEYYYSYYYHQFYKPSNPNQDMSLKYHKTFWKNIFNINEHKNKNIINILIEIYTIYDKSINEYGNILEIV